MLKKLTLGIFALGLLMTGCQEAITVEMDEERWAKVEDVYGEAPVARYANDNRQVFLQEIFESEVALPDSADYFDYTNWVDDPNNASPTTINRDFYIEYRPAGDVNEVTNVTLTRPN